MAARNKSLIKSLGPAILAEGQFDRDEIVVALAGTKKSKLIQALRKVSAAGEKSADLLLVEPVSKLMAHQDAEVCVAAAKAMGAMGLAASRFSDDMAEYLLKHPDPNCRTATLEALGNMGPDLGAVVRSCVAEQLTDEDSQVRAVAVRTLAVIGDASHVEEVLGLVNDSKPLVRSAAVEALADMVSVSDEVRSVVLPSRMAEALEQLLPDVYTRMGALQAVRKMGIWTPSQAVGHVVDALGDSNWQVRQAAVLALGSISTDAVRSGNVFERLSKLLHSDHAGIRAAAASAAGSIGPAAMSMASALAPLLSDDGVDESGLAAQMGAAARRPPPTFRMPQCAALAAFGRIGKVEYVKDAAMALAHEDWEVRKTACEALGAFGTWAVDEQASLAAMLEDNAFPVRAMACFALGQLGTSEVLHNLVDKFDDSAHSVRLHAVMAIGQLGSQSAEYASDVFKLLHDPVGHVRGAAAVTLSRLGSEAQPYASMVVRQLVEDDSEVRKSALIALGAMGRYGAAYEEEIVERLNYDSNASVREAAAAALHELSQSGLLSEEYMPAITDSTLNICDAGEGEGEGGENEGSQVYTAADKIFEEDLDGLGQHYASIQEDKKKLQSSGKWIEGIF